jgi:hypothetical protein
MTETTLSDLQAGIQNRSAFRNLSDYFTICYNFLNFVQSSKLERISSTSRNYIFYQYSRANGSRVVTRPLNVDLFINSASEFQDTLGGFNEFLTNIREYHNQNNVNFRVISNGKINKVVYTIQQSIGCISDSFDNPNQSRKIVGQLFEDLVKLIIREVGLSCEPRTISVQIPGYDEYKMSYELDLVFSRKSSGLATNVIDDNEVIGSVKTTSKDRIDRIFLDKYLLTKLMKRDIRVVAIFLHDVQRYRKNGNIFGINSTFKSNHFLGYTFALNKLDGVYYVDPTPEMVTNARLREYIGDFQKFLVEDLWRLLRG